MFRVRNVEFALQSLSTRFPFRYGIASMTQVPHLFVRVEIELDGKRSRGISADLLPPKWFTKDPQSDYETDDLPQMASVIQHAAKTTCEIPPQATFFHWWCDLAGSQKSWSADQKIAPLLANFGVSLIERAVIDAWCRSRNSRFHDLLLRNDFAIQFGGLRTHLDGILPSDFCVKSPVQSVFLRHTIGMADPLTDADISSSEQVGDGLPHSLAACIRHYGLSYFKIKLSGKIHHDVARLRNIARLITTEIDEFHFTLDGNENYSDINHFRDAFKQLRADPDLKLFFERGLLFVEQPLHRDQSLTDEVRTALADWSDSPPLIIDESDAEFDSLPRALELGYSGTSHKNCKGIIKGLTNAATIFQARMAGQEAILSSEDLANVGPVALMQDLAVVASLGISHSERNGHHYFAGLSQFSPERQNDVLRQHPVLFHRTEQGFATLRPIGGKLNLESILQSGFGLALDPSLIDLTWHKELPAIVIDP